MLNHALILIPRTVVFFLWCLPMAIHWHLQEDGACETQDEVESTASLPYG